MEKDIMEITPEMREQLRKPLPPEAISTHPTKTFLSAIKAIYVEERLNDVFGIGAWRTKVEFIESADTKPDKNGFVAKMVVAKLIFEIPAYSVYHECYGGNDNADLGDAYKGATTDAITKVGSYLEIGIDVFKGKTKAAPPTTNQSYTKPTYTPTTNQPPKIDGVCPKCGADMVLNPKTNKMFCKEKCWLKTQEGVVPPPNF